MKHLLLLLLIIVASPWARAEYIAGRDQATRKVTGIIAENGIDPFVVHDVFKKTLHKLQGHFPALTVREISPTTLEAACKTQTAAFNTTPETDMSTLFSQLRPVLEGCVDADPLNEGVRDVFLSSESYETYMLEQLVSVYDARGRFYRRNPMDSLYQDGSTGAVGVVLKSIDGKITVVSTVPGSPAQKNLVLPGDRITSIDGQDASKMSPEEAALKLRGVVGTSVTLTVARGSETKPVQLTRENMAVRSAAYRMEGTVGYLRLNSFEPGTLIDVDLGLALFREKAATGVILDLRDNDGGMLDTAIEIANNFLPANQLIVSLKGKTPQDFKTTEKPNRVTLPLVVLVNGKTASAAEALAASLQDHGRAIVIGERSAGKGAVRTVYTVNNDYKLELTVALAFTPKGKPVDGVGVQPNKPISEGAHAQDPSLPDPVLQGAVAHLSAKPLAAPQTPKL